MKTRYFTILIFCLFTTVCCLEKQTTKNQYYDKPLADTIINEILIAVTNEDYLQYGAKIAFVSDKGDTIIPFGKYAYFGTDTLKHYANVIQYSNDSTYGKHIAIDKSQNTLFDIVIFDNGPDYFHEDLVRVLRNGKMGFANKYGQVVIPCQYNFANWFKNGKVKVTYKSRTTSNGTEHTLVKSEEWFEIDKNGNRVN